MRSSFDSLSYDMRLLLHVDVFRSPGPRQTLFSSAMGAALGCCFFLVFNLSGCARIDPKSDFLKTQELVRQATGQDAYHPDKEDVGAEQTRQLMVDGLTIEEAVQVALLNNPEFQAAWMNLGMARADLVQSGLLSNPSLGGSLRLPAGGGLANLEVTMAQNIADLWQVPIRQRAARAALDQAILHVARQAAELAADVRAAYVRATGTGELHKLAIDNMSIAHQLLDLAIGRQQAGAGSELDANLSRSAVLEAELSVESARLATSEARRSLARLLGLCTDAEKIELSDPLPSSSPDVSPANDLIAVAREKRLDIRAASQAVNQANARVREEYLKVFPNVEVGLAMERAERKVQSDRDILADTARASIANGVLAAPVIQPRSERRRNTDIIIGPSWGMELPIFDQNQAQIAKAGFALRQAEKTLESTNQRMTQEVRGVRDQMTTAWRIVNTYRDQFIPLAQSNLDLSQESYKAGRASFLSVLEAQRFFIDTRRRSIEAIQAAAVTIPELERAVGVTLTELYSLKSGQPSTTQPAGKGPAEGNKP